MNNRDEGLGVRTEIKNIGSVRAVAAAVEYEINRHISIFEAGGEIFNETRAWDAENKKTISLREKEEKEVITSNFYIVFDRLYRVIVFNDYNTLLSGLPIYAWDKFAAFAYTRQRRFAKWGQFSWRRVTEKTVTRITGTNTSKIERRS